MIKGQTLKFSSHERRRMREPLLSGMHALIETLVQKLAAGDSLDNPRLIQLADKAFQGSRAAGTYTSRDAYDAVEVAVNKHLLAITAAELLEQDAESFATLEPL